MVLTSVTISVTFVMSKNLLNVPRNPHGKLLAGRPRSVFFSWV